MILAHDFRLHNEGPSSRPVGHCISGRTTTSHVLEVQPHQVLLRNCENLLTRADFLRKGRRAAFDHPPPG